MSNINTNFHREKQGKKKSVTDASIDIIILSPVFLFPGQCKTDLITRGTSAKRNMVDKPSHRGPIKNKIERGTKYI